MKTSVLPLKKQKKSEELRCAQDSGKKLLEFSRLPRHIFYMIG